MHEYPQSSEQVLPWFELCLTDLTGVARDFPACFGGQFRVSDMSRNHVSETEFYDVLPTERDRDLFEVASNLGCELAAKVFSEPDSLSAAAELSCAEDDSICYYTEVTPDDFSFEELTTLAREGRDDLFDEEWFSPAELATFQLVMETSRERALWPDRADASSTFSFTDFDALLSKVDMAGGPEDGTLFRSLTGILPPDLRPWYVVDQPSDLISELDQLGYDLSDVSERADGELAWSFAPKGRSGSGLTVESRVLSERAKADLARELGVAPHDASLYERCRIVTSISDRGGVSEALAGAWESAAPMHLTAELGAADVGVVREALARSSNLSAWSDDDALVNRVAGQLMRVLDAEAMPPKGRLVYWSRPRLRNEVPLVGIAVGLLDGRLSGRACDLREAEEVADRETAPLAAKLVANRMVRAERAATPRRV